jgi:hypothetical protein
VGEVETHFPLLSVSKPFTYALAVEQRGAEFMIERVGVSATGLPYNAVAAGAVRRTSEQNPMVNAGAIATHSYIQGTDAAAKSRAVVDLHSRMANRPLAIEEMWRARPRALIYTLAYQMKAAERFEGEVDDVAHGAGRDDRCGHGRGQRHLVDARRTPSEERRERSHPRRRSRMGRHRRAFAPAGCGREQCARTSREPRPRGAVGIPQRRPPVALGAACSDGAMTRWSHTLVRSSEPDTR